ncbi:MAG: ATP-dependent DNA helicase RecG [Flavobacteriaceae bacterium]|jgi:ATP-dependent DNA helicase RecG|nr:ATP-dependent DNA helicase RecG [Flavobacteriaceae bacterium]MBT6127836.1 ATP-dependent DNA helicase RecG [Flavobacteriaceae bacterium]MDG1028728.1 ATP-dependent DNA helicase RecG [Flavobacteriaceae bacterium]
MDVLQTPIEYLKGVGPSRAHLLKQELNLFTLQDLLHFFPHRYIDRSTFYKIKDLPRNSSEVQIKGEITKVEMISQKRGKRLVATFTDGDNIMELVWFRGHQWIKESLKLNTNYVIFGRLNWYGNRPNMPHPEMETLENFDKGLSKALQAVYPSTEKLLNKGISQRVVTKMMGELLQSQKNPFAETLPEDLRNKYKLISKNEALKNIHFPEDQDRLTAAQNRLKFEELFFIQLQLLMKNLQRKQKIKGFVFEKVGNQFNAFFKNNLPFELTNAQKRVIREIRKDIGNGQQMNRLLQGDVGSGKTIVALMVMLIAADNGFQSCLMAPTEILAKQHYQSLKSMVGGLDISIGLLTGSSKKAERTQLAELLESGELDILIGTHAVIEDKVKFKNLGLAVVDEQHRFGVAQRAKLWRKNSIPPHVLVMTATPIPRTLAMSVYGDLDISVIDELPPGRKKVKTIHRYDSNRLKVFKFIADEIQKGRQIYMVYPLIKESEKMDYKDLMDGYESISRAFPPPQYQISIVHGQMPAKDKDYEMDRFIKKQTQIMVATTVIEVGVNVPNASVMVIESAERFGLSQLHQLRGRVGRGNDQSYCILMSSHKLTNEAKTRLETMTATTDGFQIAEVDLKLRGPGDLMGTQQSGVLQLKIADIIKDNQWLKTARSDAQELLREDPRLEAIKNTPLRQTLAKMKAYQNIWNYIS